jgi:hypothetical protein
MSQAHAATSRHAGHLKLNGMLTEYSAASLLDDVPGDTALGAANLRLNLQLQQDSWDFNVHYQAGASIADRDIYTPRLNRVAPISEMFIEDDRRLFDLTLASGDADHRLWHRLDRLNVGYTNSALVVRLGRQAVSWGNGLAYNPMDIFNPFDPAAVDREYKNGDDMLYAQWLLASGNDWQLVAVPRRDPLSGDRSSQSSSVAVKYHAVSEQTEYDLLLANHYDEHLIGLGLVTNLGDAVLRGDLVTTRTVDGWSASAVASLSYSWVFGSRNWSGNLELFYNDWGVTEKTIALTDVVAEPELFERLNRRELYTLGKYYAAVLTTVEVNPRLLLNPNLFINLYDQSGLLQLSANWDWRRNLDLLLSFNLPVGEKGTEFGGLRLADSEPQQYLQTDYQVFAQLAWYF